MTVGLAVVACVFAFLVVLGLTALITAETGTWPRRGDSVNVGDRVRYKPGTGTYGYEESVQADGRVPGYVLEILKPGGNGLRARVRLTLKMAGRTQQRDRVVAVTSLTVDGVSA